MRSCILTGEAIFPFNINGARLVLVTPTSAVAAIPAHCSVDQYPVTWPEPNTSGEGKVHLATACVTYETREDLDRVSLH